MKEKPFFERRFFSQKESSSNDSFEIVKALCHDVLDSMSLYKLLVKKRTHGPKLKCMEDKQPTTLDNCFAEQSFWDKSCLIETNSATIFLSGTEKVIVLVLIIVPSHSPICVGLKLHLNFSKLMKKPALIKSLRTVMAAFEARSKLEWPVMPSSTKTTLLKPSPRHL